MSKLLDAFQGVRHFVFDVDGVFTDNNLLVTESGELLRTMNTRDGYGVKCALEAGFGMAIITGGTSKGVEKRLRGLGVDNIYLGVQKKIDCFQQLLERNSWNAQDVLYLGDDIPDMDCLSRSGMGVCPTDAVDEVKAIADYISPLRGGRGCVRDVIEKVLKSQDKWQV